jgi:hypothetical protein
VGLCGCLGTGFGLGVGLGFGVVNEANTKNC